MKARRRVACIWERKYNIPAYHHAAPWSNELSQSAPREVLKIDEYFGQLLRRENEKHTSTL